MNKERGFTLIEMIVAVAAASLIILFLAEMINQSIKVYNISIENNEAMSKITPLIKRIENDVIESNGTITAVSGITTSTFTGITIQGDFGTHTYFWDRNGSGTYDVIEGTAASGVSASIYRVSGTAIDVLLTERGSVPAGLAARYGTEWRGSYIKIKDFNLSFYRAGVNPGTTVVWDSGISTFGAIRFMKIHVELEGAFEQSNLVFDTGIRIR